MRRNAITPGRLRIDRAVSLERADALRWLGERGSSVDPEFVRGLRVFGDRLESGDLVISRLWRTAAVEVIEDLEHEGAFQLLMVVEGTCTVRVHDQTYAIASGFRTVSTMRRSPAAVREESLVRR